MKIEPFNHHTPGPSELQTGGGPAIDLDLIKSLLRGKRRHRSGNTHHTATSNPCGQAPQPDC